MQSSSRGSLTLGSTRAFLCAPEIGLPDLATTKMQGKQLNLNVRQMTNKFSVSMSHEIFGSTHWNSLTSFLMFADSFQAPLLPFPPPPHPTPEQADKTGRLLPPLVPAASSNRPPPSPLAQPHPRNSKGVAPSSSLKLVLDLLGMSQQPSLCE